MSRLLSAAILLALLGGGIISISCSEPEDPKSCKYDHQCKGEGERCVFEDPKCYVYPGECQGRCQVVDNKGDQKCECKKDTDCDYPFEGCAACKCYKRDVLPCKSDADCGQGRMCLGEPGKKICYVRKNCSKDSDCLPGYVCREKSCCNKESGRCPGQCKEGLSCKSDNDCLICDMVCVSGKCTFKKQNNCGSISCKSDRECAACNGKCIGGMCRTNTCVGITCTTNGDCVFCGGTCIGGYCKKT